MTKDMILNLSQSKFKEKESGQGVKIY
jgi:hypothetical protein